MAGELQSGMQCSEFEALLADALDGTLHGSALAAFEAHQNSCPGCKGLSEEARVGMHWLKGLDEFEPPRNLVHNILAQTIGTIVTEQVEHRPAESWTDKLKAWAAGLVGPVATPRFAMSFGMAFFSITMLLNIAGFHFADFRHVDLSSKGVTKMYYTAEARVVRYYQNIRLVYEIESRVRDLKRAATPDTQQQQQQQQQQQEQEEGTPKKLKDQSQYKQDQIKEDSREGGQRELTASAAFEPGNTQARLNRSES